MTVVAASVLPILFAFICFGVIIILRRVLRGYPALQEGDIGRIVDVVSHASPMLAACIVYNHAVNTKADARLELLAALMVLAALAVAVYRLMKRLDAQKLR